MNPAFTGLPATLTAPAVLPGATSNNESIQSDSASSCGFGGIFDGVCSALSEQLDGTLPAPADSQALLAALQDLPQGGKLLPLVQETLDAVAAGAGDLAQFAARLSTELKRLASELNRLAGEGNATTAGLAPGETLAPAATLALALQPLVQEQPGLQTLLPAEITSALARLDGQENKAGSEQILRNLSSTLTHAPVDKAVATATQTPAGDPSASAREASTPFALDTAALSQAQPQADAMDDGERSMDLTALMSAIKRLSPDTPRPVATESSVLGTTSAQASAATTTAPTPVVPAATVSVNTPLGQSDWDQALGERIQWLASQKAQGAQVRLNPANLGPMEVRIQVQNDQASVQFSSHHAVVREALEAALPRLRDMFESSGVQLVNVDVSGGSFGGQQGATQNAPAPQRGWWSGDVEMTAENAAQTPLSDLVASGRLDLFA